MTLPSLQDGSSTFEIAGYDLSEAWGTAQTMAIEFAPRLLGAVAVWVIGRWIARRVANLVGKLVEKRSDVTLAKFLTNMVYMLLATMVVLAALQTLGVSTTSFIAVIGAAGLAIGLALQGSLSNFAAGVMIMLFRPFRVGDFIEAAGVSGVVEEIQVFSTQMRTGDNKHIIVPNGEVTKGTIVNYSTKPTRRIDLEFGIGYDDDIPKAKKILERIVGEEQRVLKDPAPVVAVSALADSSVNLLCRPWVQTADYWAVRWDLLERVKLAFDAEGISIPFPQRDVHLHQVAG